MVGTATSEPPPKKKRKVKELPDGLSGLTEANFWKGMKFRLESESQETGDEVKVAYEVSLGDDEDDDDSAPETTIELHKLTLDQLRRFCRNVGIGYVNSFTKFQCRRELSILANYQEQKEKGDNGLSTASETRAPTLSVRRATPAMERVSERRAFPSMQSVSERRASTGMERRESTATEKRASPAMERRASPAMERREPTVVERRESDNIVRLINVGTSIANQMKEANILAKESNRIAKQSQLIMLAQHLGKEDILEGLLADLVSGQV